MLPGIRGLAPEYRNLLRTALVQLTDEFFEDAFSMKHIDSDFQETHMWIFLPPEPYDQYDLVFAKKFLACLITVGHKIESSSFEMLSCVAEQLAMEAIIDQAETLADLLGVPVDLRQFEAEVLAGRDPDQMYDLGPTEWFKPFQSEDPSHPYVTWH